MKKNKIVRKMMVIILTFVMILTSMPAYQQQVKASTTLLWPVEGHTSLSRGVTSWHDAIDINDGSIYGATVRAALDGTVEYKFTCEHNLGIYDKCDRCHEFGTGVVIKGIDGRHYSYAHMIYGSIPANVYPGAYVKMGQELGKVGMTGAATGPHLHFKITNSWSWWQSAAAVNPMNESYIYNINVTPQAPANIRINKSDLGIGDALTASWNASSGATRYDVKLICTTNSAYNQSTSISGTSVSFSIRNAGTYKVTVSASNSAGTSGNNSSANCIAHDNVLVQYVDWENQTIGNPQSVKWGGNASTPVPPEREGYTFQNWSSDGKNVKANTTIKAIYKINTYSVSFVDYKGDVIDKVQKVEYMSSANEPTDIPCKNGYIFAGWSTNEYKEVKKSLTVKATYVWENSDLPIVTEIKSATRNDEGTGYTVNVNLTNFPDNFTKGKLVVALMTKSGKMVASETRAISMPETDELSEKITVLYSGLASRVQVSMIGVIDDETTGTPKSKIVTGAVDVGNEWSDWSTTVPEGEDIIKESRTEYRYKDSKIIKSTGTPTTPNGYSLTNTSNTGTYTSWGNWSGWSRNWVGANTLTDVQSQNGYRICAFACSRCGRRDPFGGACSNCGAVLTWVQTEDTVSGYARGYLTTDEAGSNLKTKGRVIINGVSWYFELNGCNNGEPQSASVSGNGKGQVIYPIYRYRTRQEYKNYTYWMNEFSNWQATKVDSSSDKKVETRTTYRFKTNSTDVPCYNYKRYKYTNINNGKIVYTYTSKYADSMEYPGEWEYNRTFTELKKIATVDDGIDLFNGTGEDSWYSADVNDESSSLEYKTKDTLEDKNGVKRTVEGDIPNSAGKVATLLVYKGQNEDPIASQIEYISQVKIGENGHYKFEFITKEEPTAKTGDFIITLGVEGSTNYQVIGKIEAPKQVFTVDFVDDEGNSIGEQKKVADGGTVEAPEAPEKEGYDFIGWDTGLKNIRENMVITAQYKKKKCTVIFVDWDNTSLEIKEFDYGDKLTTDNIPSKEGQKFDKWVDSANKEVKTVTDNMIVEASYKDTKYTVIFKDWEGNVISEQQIAYGEKAEIPDDLSAPSANEVFKCWNGYDEAMYVTKDIVISPVAQYTEDSPSPIFTVQSGTYKTAQTVALYSTIANANIYYYIADKDSLNSDDMYMGEDVFEKYEKPFVISESAVIYAYSKIDNMNQSEITYSAIQIGEEVDTTESTVIDETTKYEPTTTSDLSTTESTVTNETSESASTTIGDLSTTEYSPSNETTTSGNIESVKKPEGIVGIVDATGNYNVFWNTNTNVLYYNIYLNGVIMANTINSSYMLAAPLFASSGIYTIGIQAVGKNGVSEISQVTYTVTVADNSTIQQRETNISNVESSKQEEKSSANDVITTKSTVDSVILKKQKITTVKIRKYKVNNLKKKKVVFNLKAKTTGDGQLQYSIYKCLPSKVSKYISVSKKGKVTIKKGAPKGTYRILVIAQSTDKYDYAKKIVKIKVK